MRPPLWTLPAILVLAAAGWFLFTNQSGLFPAVPQEEPKLLTCEPKGEDCLYHESTPHYEISVTYPNLTDARSVAIEQELHSQIEYFKSDISVMLDDAEKERLVQMGRKYELAIEYKPFLGSGYTSFEFDIYLDTGGAHPNGFFKTLVFDAQGKEVEMADLFKPEARYLEAVSVEAYTQVLAQLNERVGEISADMEETVRMGTSPTPETLQNFLIDGEDLVILIPPYQAAAYAAGTFEVRIPLSKLSDLRP